MNNSFDFNSKKYIILLILICLVFAIFIIKAFDYLPDTDVLDTNNAEIEHINSQPVSTEVQQDNSESNESEKYVPVQKSGVLYKSNDPLMADDKDFEEIDAPIGITEEKIPTNNIDDNSSEQLPPDIMALKSIVQAKKYAANNNYAESIEEYKKAISISNDSEIKAEALEGISILYAKTNKYGTALSFAAKAYKESPSLSREMLIAKIYYSAGKTDTAIARLNEMLKRGF